MRFSIPLCLLAFLCAGLPSLPASEAATYEPLVSFTRPGAQPFGALVLAGDGNFYGTTVAGGANGLGSVFRVTAAGVVSTVVSFTGTGGPVPGAGPTAGLTLGADGSLFGTTGNGGAGNFGTVFKVTPANEFTLLASFTGPSGAAKGSVPQDLMRHSNGNFYGVTLAGGTTGFGTVFQMTPGGAITTLAEFTGATGAKKGGSPQGPLAFSGPTLYGVTHGGGAGGHGVAYSLATDGTAWTTMAEFTGTAGGQPGSGPSGGLLLHTDGALYGTTEFGGANSFGTAFKITPGVSPAFASLRSFADPSGSQPVGLLVRGPDAQLYGATAAGGSSGFGTLFKMTTTGTHSVLAHFSGETGTVGGATPRAGLVAGADEALYGVTSAGGPGNLGVVFRLTPAGGFSTLARLSTPLGWTPSGPPTPDGNGALLFPMAFGGDAGGGTLVRLAPDGAASLASPLGGAAGTTPMGGLVKVGTDLFGVTATGGAFDRGTAYKYALATGASVVANYATSSGSASEGALVAGSDAALYGVSLEGGTTGRGTVYKMTTGGARTRLVSFTGTAGAAKGARPRGPLAPADAGRFYGVTERGGAADAGTIFQILSAGTWGLVAEFTAGGPRWPRGGLVAAPDGNLYGTTSAGGAGDAGTLVRINPITNTWAVAADFSAPTTGRAPAGPLAVGPDGALYGLTTAGGAGGFGTAFRYTTAGALETLVSLTGDGGAAPGRADFTDSGTTFTAGLSFGSDGKLYGVVPAGGPGGGGTGFRLNFQGPLDAWKLSELGDPAASDFADPESDGVAALVEYGLGLHASVSDTSEVPAARPKPYPTGTFLSLTVPRDPSRHDVTLIVEATSTLVGPWTELARSLHGAPFAGPGYVTGDAVTPGHKDVEIRDLETVAQTDRRFIRLRVTR